VHRGRNLSKASLKFYRIRGQRVALKDYGDLPFWIRNTVGRFFVRREARAYQQASGSDGLPAFHGRVGPFALALEWIDATPLASVSASSIPPGALGRLRGIVEALHARGIALGDLHHRDVLISPHGAVHLVDLAAAWCAGASPGFVRRALLRRLQDVDRVALARIEARCLGIDERKAVLDLAGPGAARRHAQGRKVKAFWNALRRRGRNGRTGS
jgi:hypothetical protein